jgi:hypothetical protein
MSRIWIYLILIFALSTKAEWSFSSIGSPRNIYFYYENDQVKGICVFSDEGILSMLDPENGSILWRDNPSDGRAATRFIAKDQCNIFT